MKSFIDVCKAMSDPNRVKIIKMLQHKVMCVCEITRALELAQPTVSKHLKVLEGADLIPPAYCQDKRTGPWTENQIAI